LAPNQLIGAAQVWWPQDWQVDIHIMSMHPEQHVQQLITMKPHMITVHAEAQGDIPSLLQTIKMSGIKAGVALQRSTVPSDVVPMIEAADHIMIFSGELGKYGGTASLMQLEKVRLVKMINNGAEIGWDGGIAVENAFSLAQGGVEVFNVGGAIQKAADPKAAYDALLKEVNKQGVM
jgi:ribulose-phosphate 3-epimerase